MPTENEQIVELLKRIEEHLSRPPDHNVTTESIWPIGGLSAIDENLGIIRAGEFRSGNGKQPGDSFSGVRIGYPPFTYNSEDWNIAGVNADTLEFGLRASDGVALFGGGNVQLDSSGMWLNIGTSQYDSSSSISWGTTSPGTDEAALINVFDGESSDIHFSMVANRSGDFGHSNILIAARGGNTTSIQLSMDTSLGEKIRWDVNSVNVMTLEEGGLQIKSKKELRFYDNGNYVGFEAPDLSADQIWVLPAADGADGDVLSTDGAGTLSWLSGASEKSWAFRSRAGASGTIYAGGFYLHSGAANVFSSPVTFGTANSSYAAHFFVVNGGTTVDELTLRITGTSIDDSGNRVTSDTEDIVVPTSTSPGRYYETTKKWLGQLSIVTVSGTTKAFDYGLVKYWDNNNSDFAVVGLEATWLGGANDSAPDILLRHHKGTAGNTDWAYTGSGATPPAAIVAMATDHSTEKQVVTGENGAWKRTNLSTNIGGSGSEGIVIEIVTTANKAFELGTFLLRITPQ